jgi:hypothetical protein
MGMIYDNMYDNEINRLCRNPIPQKAIPAFTNADGKQLNHPS